MEFHERKMKWNIYTIIPFVRKGLLRTAQLSEPACRPLPMHSCVHWAILYADWHTACQICRRCATRTGKTTRQCCDAGYQ